MIFETHAHYTDEEFEKDRDELLSSLKENGISTVINISSSLSSVEKTLQLTEQYDFIYAAVGIHPSETQELNEENFALLKAKASSKKVVAIGEIGLDYHWPEPDRSCQKKWFLRQLDLAKELNKPVVIHSRDAAADTWEILKEENQLQGVIHCYSYSKEMAQSYLNKGWYFGIGGVVTFSNAKKLVEAVEFLPLDHILLETDSPYLSPAPNRGKRNSSLNLPLIAEKIAFIKQIPYETVVETTRQNAQRLFFGNEHSEGNL